MKYVLKFVFIFSVATAGSVNAVKPPAVQQEVKEQPNRVAKSRDVEGMLVLVVADDNPSKNQFLTDKHSARLAAILGHIGETHSIANQRPVKSKPAQVPA